MHLFMVVGQVLTEAGEADDDNARLDRVARETMRHLALAAGALGIGRCPPNRPKLEARPGNRNPWGEAFGAAMAEQRAEIERLVANPGEAIVGISRVATNWRLVEPRLCLVAGTEADNPEGGMLPLNRLAADYLESIGPMGEGAKEAADLREAAREQWTAWEQYRQEHKPASWFDAWQSDPARCPDLLKPYRTAGVPVAEAQAFKAGHTARYPECPYLLALARAVWLDVVKPRIEAERQRAARIADRETRFPVPTAARSIVQSHARLLHGETVVCPQEGGGAWAVESGTGERIGRVEMERLRNLAQRHGLVLSDSEAVRELLQSKIRDAGTVTGISTFRYFAKVAHRSMVVHEEPPPVLWPATDDGWFRGGLDELARSMGFRSSQDADKVRAALDAMAVVQLPIPGDNDTGHLDLLTWQYIPRRGRTGARIRVVLYEPLCGLRIAQRRIGERRLTPIPDLPAPDRFVGDRTAHAAQLLMQQWLMLHLTDHSLDLVQDGGVEITDSDWRRMADRSELPSRLLAPLRDAYLGPPLLPVLKRTPSGLYVPGDERILAVLKEQGKALVKWSKRGSKGSREDT